VREGVLREQEITSILKDVEDTLTTSADPKKAAAKGKDSKGGKTNEEQL